LRERTHLERAAQVFVRKLHLPEEPILSGIELAVTLYDTVVWYDE